MKLLAIVIIVLLVGLFIFSYILNKRTPKPDICHDMEISEEHCKGCQVMECSRRSKI